MSTDENSDVVTTVAGQKRPGALQLGPRKKPFVLYHCSLLIKLLTRLMQLWDRPPCAPW